MAILRRGPAFFCQKCQQLSCWTEEKYSGPIPICRSCKQPCEHGVLTTYKYCPRNHNHDEFIRTVGQTEIFMQKNCGAPGCKAKLVYDSAFTLFPFPQKPAA